MAVMEPASSADMSMSNTASQIAVVALGGNAIMQAGQEGNIAQQFANSRHSMQGVMTLIRRGYRVVITHGNGPQVGNLFLMVEATRALVPELPLGVCVADTQGQMGYMLQQSLYNCLQRADEHADIVTLVTQVLVNRDDPAFAHPTKPIGPFYSREQMESIQAERGWTMVEDSGRGYRLVVASPHPQGIVEIETIRALLADGVCVIAGGGGGIPVIQDADGGYCSIDAVVDKDLTSSVLAREVGADLLVILTGVDQVALRFNTPDEQPLDQLSAAEARRLYDEGHFPAGSMGPKILAAIDFVDHGGSEVLITSIEALSDALDGTQGTRIGREGSDGVME